LSTPNPDDPLDERIAKHWRDNEDEALAKAREMTKMHAMGHK
jgi:ubiquitin-conjugating enzyme E2 N